ncbi:methyltransferase domain-containing protein [Patescibacteria group bacterium]|nr:methyltransferase domain-containing protein [Patescibacteria group bacterium]
MFLNPQSVLEHLPFVGHSRVGDFGAGAGHFTFAAAERLNNEGRVYAFEIFSPSVDALSREAEKRNARVHAMNADLNSHIPLRDNLLHAGIVANTLHQLQNREQFVKELSRVVEPKGKVLVVDWASSFKNMGPHEDFVILPGDAARLFRNVGFSISPMLPAGTHHYAFIAERQHS